MSLEKKLIRLRKKRKNLKFKLVHLVTKNETTPSISLDHKIEKCSNKLQQLHLKIDKLENS